MTLFDKIAKWLIVHKKLKNEKPSPTLGYGKPSIRNCGGEGSSLEDDENKLNINLMLTLYKTVEVQEAV